MRRNPADLLALSVNVRRRVCASDGIVTQLVTHPRLGGFIVTACVQSPAKVPGTVPWPGMACSQGPSEHGKVQPRWCRLLGVIGAG